MTINYLSFLILLTLSIPLSAQATQKAKSTTAAANVHIVSDTFYMPQLNRYRRVWIYLPLGYQKNTKRHYPVLYLQDGQNLFDQSTSFSGEWAIDEALNRLGEKGGSDCIVVGVDNGGNNRINEYAPWRHPTYGGGEGNAYARFVVETLKPFVDKNYRTKRKRQHTAIGGSSLGATIALYTIAEYPHVFSKGLIFSPAIWFTRDSTLAHLAQNRPPQYLRLYFTAGTKESTDMMPDIEKTVALLSPTQPSGKSPKKNNIICEVVPRADGQHNEAFWQSAFEAAYVWLFENKR